MNTTIKKARDIKSPTGNKLICQSWSTEAAYRMLHNNLDREVAENPDELVVYGGIGKAARTWKDFDAIADTLKTLTEDETLLVQSGKPVGVFRTALYWTTHWHPFSRETHLGAAMSGGRLRQFCKLVSGHWVQI